MISCSCEKAADAIVLHIIQIWRPKVAFFQFMAKFSILSRHPYSLGLLKLVKPMSKFLSQKNGTKLVSRQEQWDKREDDRRSNGIESNPVIISHLSGNMYYQINNNPPTFIMADKKASRLIEIVFRTSQTSHRRNTGGGKQESLTLKQTLHTRPYLACIPDKVIINKSPINSMINDR